MRVAALYDIHGNLPALEAVIGEVRDASVDRVVVGGDVFPGPMSGECLRFLLDLEIPVRFLRGNGDREVVELAAGGDIDRVPEAVRESMRWVAERLEPEHRRVIASWPPSVRVEIDGLGDVLFCHATPRSDTEIFLRTTPEDDLLAIFEGVDAPVVVCGHTHMQFDRMIGGVRVVNAGSVGMPFGEPGAYWLLLGPGVELRKTRYDLPRAAERIRATDHPQADDFAARNVLQPPSEDEILALWSKSEGN
jgi:predicted phosphodiesterase